MAQKSRGEAVEKPFNAAQSKWRKNQKLSLGRESAVFKLHTFDAHPEGGGD
jgi:hypothetical protein